MAADTHLSQTELMYKPGTENLTDSYMLIVGLSAMLIRFKLRLLFWLCLVRGLRRGLGSDWAHHPLMTASKLRQGSAVCLT